MSREFPAKVSLLLIPDNPIISIFCRIFHISWPARGRFIYFVLWYLAEEGVKRILNQFLSHI